MDNWKKYLLESHSEETYKKWAKRLDLFRFFRAYGGHANDGDSLDVSYSYSTTDELVNFLKGIGVNPVIHSKQPEQPEPGKSYPGDVFAKFASIIPDTKWIEQPKHCKIQDIEVFIWCDKNRITISVGKDYTISEQDFLNAEKCESYLSSSVLHVLDPPVDTKHYICPKYYPSYYS